MEGSNGGLTINVHSAGHRDPWLLTNGDRNPAARDQNFGMLTAHNDLKRKSSEVKILRKAADVAQIKLKANERILGDLNDALEEKRGILIKKQKILEKIDITNQNLIQTLNTLELNPEIINRIVTSHAAASKDNGIHFSQNDEDAIRQNLRMKETLINLAKDHYRAVDGIRHMGTGIEELRLSLQGTQQQSYQKNSVIIFQKFRQDNLNGAQLLL